MGPISKRFIPDQCVQTSSCHLSLSNVLLSRGYDLRTLEVGFGAAAHCHSLAGLPQVDAASGSVAKQLNRRQLSSVPSVEGYVLGAYHACGYYGSFKI